MTTSFFAGIVTKRIFQAVTCGYKIFFCLIIKKKKNKKSNHEWGDRIPPHSLIFSSISENLKKIQGERIVLEIIVFN